MKRVVVLRGLRPARTRPREAAQPPASHVVKPVKPKWGASGGFGRRRKRPPVHPQDEVDDYETALLEQTQSRPGSWVDEEYRRYAIHWLAARARKAPLKKSGVPTRRAKRLQQQAQKQRQRREREVFYALLRARYFVEIVSRSARGLPLLKLKSDTSEELIKEAVKKLGMRRKAVDYEWRIASFYSTVNSKWEAWVASIRTPQERPIRARVRSTDAAAPEFSINHHRTQWLIVDVDERKPDKHHPAATARAAAVAVRIVKRATAGVEWPNARVTKLFADFTERTVRLHFQNHFERIIKRERGTSPTGS